MYSFSLQYPPLIERAHTRKQSAAEAEGLRWQLEKKENEMIELKKVIKSRIDDVSNYKVSVIVFEYVYIDGYVKLRLEMADARLEQCSKVDSQRESHLQLRIDELNIELKKQKK